jgi:hypothetical protein
MAAESRQNPWTTFIWGALFLTAGLIFWLDRLDRVDARDWLEWWPVALLVVAVAHIPQRRWIAAGVWALIGGYFLLRKLGYDAPPFWQLLGLWPLLFSVAGISLIVQALRAGRSGAQLRAVAVMAGNQVSTGSQEFTGGQAVAVMGGCEIDLNGARLAGTDVTIDVLAFWGGIEIRVPHGWEVVNRVLPILGGFEDKSAQAAAGAPRLFVRGTVIMGGVEVKHKRGSGAGDDPVPGEPSR